MAPGWDEKTIFLAALDLDPEKREAFLLESCPNEATRQRIRALLQRHDQQTIALPAGSASEGVPSDPNRIDEFVILRRLGAGGMGVVYLAEDTVLGRRVAVKVLASHLTGSEEFVARFRAEARNAASLEHPGIVSVYRFGFDGVHHYIVSEFVDGTTLSDVIEQEAKHRPPQTATGPIRQWHRRCAQVLAAIAEALDHSHRAGVIHRDVKPSNILIDSNGTPRLTDFGIAKQLSDKTLTRSADVIGSCYYMSPEQAAVAQTPIDRRSDIFSLGVVLHEMLALRRPFVGRDANQVLRAVISEAAPRLRSVDRLIPKDLETICSKALEKDRLQRYQTAGHMAADLRCFLAGDPILARPPGIVRRTSRWTRRHRVEVAVTSCVGLALAVAYLIGLRELEKRESQVRLAIRSVSTPSCMVVLQQVNLITRAPEETGKLLGITPIEGLHVPKGSYRITVVSPDGTWFAEFNLLLVKSGRDHGVNLVVGPTTHKTTATASPSPLAESSPKSGKTTLWARSMPTTDVVRDEDMLLVKAGDYPFGWATRPEDVHTFYNEPRTIHLTDVYIDRREVSNREYKAFVDATGHPDPWQRTKIPYDDSLADLPVVNVSLEDAEAYARWRGKRLPTMYEWKAGAGGIQGFMYPWGNDPAPLEKLRGLSDDERQILVGGTDDHAGYALYGRYMVPVSQRTSEGDLLHTLDNVREYTSTIDSRGEVMLSGPFLDLDPSRWDLRKFETYLPDAHHTTLGFRCAKSAAPPPSH